MSMVKVSSRVNINLPAIEHINALQEEALKQTAEALLTEIKREQVIPMDQGTLSGEATFVDATKSARGTVYIVSSTPYARRLYFHPEYHFSKAEHKNAKGEWFEDWMPGGKYEDFAREAFAKIMRRLM